MVGLNVSVHRDTECVEIQRRVLITWSVCFTQHREGERGSEHFVFCFLLNVVRRSPNVSLFTGILSFVPREPVDFRAGDGMNANDMAYFKCSYSLDISMRMFTRGDECSSLPCHEWRFHGMSAAAIPYVKNCYGSLRYVVVSTVGAGKHFMVVMYCIVYPLLYMVPLCKRLKSFEDHVRVRKSAFLLQVKQLGEFLFLSKLPPSL